MRNRQLDGLRAVGICGVLFHHFHLQIPWYLEYGPISVRMFFALTGYFMTLWLWKSEAEGLGGRVGEASLGERWRALCAALPTFHLRRFVRLVPALYLSLIAVGLLGVLFSAAGQGALPDPLGEWIVRLGYSKASWVPFSDLWWQTVFLSNYYVVHLGYWPPVVSHLWSLSVQEQFYVLWPLLIFLTPRKSFLWVLVGASCLAVCYRAGCLLMGADSLVRWLMLPGALDSFCVGAGVAWWRAQKANRFGKIPRCRGKVWRTFGFLAVFCLLVARWVRGFPQESVWIATVEVWEAVFLTWVVLGTVQGWKGLIGWILSRPLLVYVGRVSLGIYLYHVLVHIVLGPILDQAGITIEGQNVLRVWILVAASVGLAGLSWKWIEQPLAGKVRTTGKAFKVQGLQVGKP